MLGPGFLRLRKRDESTSQYPDYYYYSMSSGIAPVKVLRLNGWFFYLQRYSVNIWPRAELGGQQIIVRWFFIIFALEPRVLKLNSSEKEQGRMNLKLNLSKYSNDSRVVRKRISETLNVSDFRRATFREVISSWLYTFVLVSTCRLSFFWHLIVSWST